MSAKCTLKDKIDCPVCGDVATLKIFKINSGFFTNGSEFYYDTLCYTCNVCGESFTTNESDGIALSNYHRGLRAHNRKNKINEYFR